MHDVKLHDLIDVVGILDPLRHMDDADDESDFDELEETLQQENMDENGEAPGIKVPRRAVFRSGASCTSCTSTCPLTERM